MKGAISHKAPSTLTVGLALFSMFFGAGNLIFPLMLGAKYEGYFYLCAIAFVITAVMLPAMGLLAMIPAKGDFNQLFSGLAPKKYARWFFLLVLLFWIPLGSGPRCVVLAHGAVLEYGHFPVWLFSSLFLLLTYFCLMKRNFLLELLGKILTPILLLAIFFIVISSFYTGAMDPSSYEAREVFLESLVDGYYTQDLIAAIFFSSSLITMLKGHMGDPRLALRKTWQASLIAIVLLAILYSCLMAASAIHGEHLRGLSGERLVFALAHLSLGPYFGGLSSLAISLACFTTEIALVLVFTDFLKADFFPKMKQKNLILIVLFIIWLMSLLKFDGIMALIGPAMQIIYPILFVLVVRILWRKIRLGVSHGQ